MQRLTCPSPPPLEQLLLSDIERQSANADYWNPANFYALRREAVECVLKPAAAELWAMCRDFADRAVKDDEILASLGIPQNAWAGVSESWRRNDPVTLARFDLSFDGETPPKLHECNIDVVGLLFEATDFQTRWMDRQRQEDPRLRRAGQFSDIEEHLAAALGRAGGGKPIRLMAMNADPYDELWIEMHRRILAARNIACITESVRTLDEACRSLALQAAGKGQAVVKCIRWDVISGSDDSTRLIVSLAPKMFSPMWTMVLSSKGCLPWLWSLNPGHPNLLAAHFTPRPLSDSRGVVAKPLFSIQGQNITLSDREPPGRSLVTSGPDMAGPRIFQELCYLPSFRTAEGLRWASTGAWIADECCAGLSLTESSSPVISSVPMHYVPHVLL